MKNATVVIETKPEKNGYSWKVIPGDGATRIWQVPMDEMTKTKTGPTRVRHECAMKDKAFDLIRNLPILETHAQQFLGDLDDVRTCLQKAHRAAALIYAHFKKEFGLPDK